MTSLTYAIEKIIEGNPGKKFLFEGDDETVILHFGEKRFKADSRGKVYYAAPSSDFQEVDAKTLQPRREGISAASTDLHDSASMERLVLRTYRLKLDPQAVYGEDETYTVNYVGYHEDDFPGRGFLTGQVWTQETTSPSG